VLRRRQSFEQLRPKIDELEERSQLSARAVGNYHRVWRGERLQPCGNIRSLSDDGLLLCYAGPNQITNNRESRSHPDSALQLDGFMRPQYGHGGDQRETGSHCPFSIVFARLRVTEINQRAVAHISGDKSVEPPQNFPYAPVIRCDYLAQVFGIEARRQSG
jgi:hypothetical protein